MGNAKEGFKKHGSAFTCENPKEVDIQDDPNGPFYNLGRFDLPLREALLNNIVAFGVRKPIFISTFVPGKNYIYDGEQRYRHWCAALGIWKERGEPMKPLQCIMARVEPKIASLIGTSCNNHSLEETPMNKISRASVQLQLGVSEDDVATAFGITVNQLKNWLKADSLCAPVKKLIEKGEIAVSAAVQFAKLEPAEQKAEVEKLIESGAKPTVKNAAKTVKGDKPDKKGWTRQEFRDFCENEAMPKQIRDFVDYAYFGDVEVLDKGELDFFK